MRPQNLPAPASIHPSLIMISASSFFLGFNCDAPVIFVNVIANAATLVLGRAEQDIDRLQIAQRRLRIDVEFAQ